MPDSIVFLILGVFTAIVVIVFVASIGAVPLVDEAPCTGLSMLTRAQNWLNGVTVFQAPSSRFDRRDLCPPMEVKISSRTSDEKTLETIADQMALCHRNYGEGTLDLFAQKGSSKNVYCVLCSHISFEGTGEVEGLSEFLVMERVPGRHETYAEYIGSLEDELFMGAEIPPFTFDRDKEYGVLYLYGQETAFFKNTFDAGTTGALVGGTAGFIMAGAAAGAILGPPGSALGAVVTGTIVLATATAGWIGGASIGFGFGSTHLPSGTDYIGATVLVPWDRDVFENSLKCSQMV